jgi:hypothetical protein
MTLLVIAMGTKKRAVTCREAVQEVFAGENGILSIDQVVERVCALYPDKPWKASTIKAHLVGLTINPPANSESSGSAQHVWVCNLGDGRYRRWHPEPESPQEAAHSGPEVAENDGQTEDPPQLMNKQMDSSQAEAILERLDAIGRRLSAEDSLAILSSRRKREIGLFIMGIAIVLSVSFAALARETPVLVFAALGAFFLSGVMSNASGFLCETALSEDAELAKKINGIGGSAFLFDNRAMMRWEASKSSARLRVSLVCGVLMYVGLASMALLVVLSFVYA